MTKRGLEKILTSWQRRLPLDAWTVWIDWTEPARPGARASVFIPDDYHRARICIAEDYTSWDEYEAECTLAHELIHLLLRDLDAVAAQAADMLGVEARTLSRKAWDHAEEGVVDLLACRLVEAWGT